MMIGGLIIALLVSQRQLIRTWLTKAGGEPARIRLDVQAVLGPMMPVWRNLAQGGEVGGLKLDQIRQRVKALRPEYIRIDHIYDMYVKVVRNETGQLEFDWTGLDEVIKQIQQLGAKPFMSVSYMPAAISRGDIVEAPLDWNEWVVVVQKTIEHVSGKDELNQTGVYYEIWNEPDLFGKWKTYGEKNYLTLYDYAAAGAERATRVNQFKIGGAATTGFYKNWAKTLFKFVEDSRLRLDFFSWHRYDSSWDEYVKDVGELEAVLTEFPSLSIRVERIISESGHNSENDPGYDTSVGAAHTLGLARSLMGLVDKVFVFEIEDGKDEEGKALWGRWGLLTHRDFGSQPKPRYEGLLMLEQLGEERIALTGEGTWVKGIAAKRDEATQILLVNYDEESRHSEVVPITFSGLSGQDFVIEENWLRGRQTKIEVATTAAELKHEIFMPANSVALITLTPKL